MTGIERQIQIEADAVHEGVLKYFQGQKYRQATDSRAGSDLITNSLWPLALKIERVQIGLAIAEDKKLPQYGLAILAIRHEKGALITLGVMLTAHTGELTALATPVHRPMIVEPKPWTSLPEGGYLATPMNLLKRPPGKWAQELLNSAGLLAVFSAVNAIQNTGWRINQYMLGIMRKAWDAGYPLFGLDRHTLEQLPPKLPDDADPKEIKKRKQERADAFNLNSRLKGLKKVMPLRLSLADWLRDKPRFYFPQQLDHRGRAYPVPQLINPQADDSGRALLEFDEGKPLGPRGAYWLAIHIADCYG